MDVELVSITETHVTVAVTGVLWCFKRVGNLLVWEDNTGHDDAVVALGLEWLQEAAQGIVQAELQAA